MNEAAQIQANTLDEVLSPRNREPLQRALDQYIRQQRWFGAKARTVEGISVKDAVELVPGRISLAILEIEYTEGEPQHYLLPLGLSPAAEQSEGSAQRTHIAGLKNGALLVEPVADPEFAAAMLEVISKQRLLRGHRGGVQGQATRACKELRGPDPLEGHVLQVEQSNTSIVYGDRLFMKLFRKLEGGRNPDLEITRFLSEETQFRHVPQVAGSLEYQDDRGGEPMALAILQNFTTNSGDAWRYTLDHIGRYFDTVLSDVESLERIKSAPTDQSIFTLMGQDPPAVLSELIGGYLNDARLLGQRTAQMHVALASREDNRDFAPEPFTPHYQRSIYQSMRSQVVQTLQTLRKRVSETPELRGLIEREPQLQERLRAVLEGRMGGARIRIHGDYHLGQVLHTGTDFVIIDFEGEPARPLSERRLKRNGLRDVAGMMRSFHYAPYAVLYGQAPGHIIREEDLPSLEVAAHFWYQWVAAAFLQAYLEESRALGATHLPSEPAQVQTLLRAYLLEKALYEVLYELNNRPTWLNIPLRGALELLD